jgi:hypothetical protein
MNTNERLTLFSFEIWCSLGDEELNRSKSESVTFSLKEGGIEVPKKSLKKSHKFFHALFDQLFDVCINYINIENINEEEDTWDISKACNYILGIIVQLVDTEKIDKVLNYVFVNFDNQNLMLKNSAILIFASAIDSSHKNKVYEYVKIYFDKIIFAMENENERIKKSATYLMFKVTKVFSKNLGLNSVENLINKCLILLNFNNKNSNKICSIFSNLIKGRGDLTTVKNDSKKIN